MRKLAPPIFNLSDLYKKCTSSISSDEARIRLESIFEILLKNEILYGERASLFQLYLFRDASAVGSVNKDELSRLYSQTFVRKNGPTRDIYDFLRKSPGNICPLCCQRTVSTLDHYLPKARHPAFAVTPINLVPSCKDCNIDSQQKQSFYAGDQTLHPYFDDVDGEIWLVADAVDGGAPAIQFRTQEVSIWGATKNEMIASHFKTYGLASLYSDHAGPELVNIYIDLEDAGLLQDAFSISEHLANEARRRRRAFKNSWQSALYGGLAESVWFCSEGVHDIKKSELFPGARSP